MCHFLSALVTRTGEVLTLPEYTDGHEDLVDYFNLTDDGQKFCRVEFTPGAGAEVVDGYKFRVDEDAAPSWFDDEMKEKVISELKRRVTAMLVSDERKILIGGCHVLCDGASIRKVIGARIVAMLGSSKVGEMLGSSNVGEMRGSSNVGEMKESKWDSPKILNDNRDKK